MLTRAPVNRKPCPRSTPFYLLMILGAIAGRNPALALELTWTSDSQVLKNALLAGPPPVGITLGTVAITPAGNATGTQPVHESATVTLEVAGVPGVYRLRLAEGSYGDMAGRWRQMARGQELTVIVGGP